MSVTGTSTPVYGKTYRGTAPENYERYFVPVIGGPFAQHLVAMASLRPGERVIDVACGTGVVARLAAQRVGAGGEAVGADINPGMLAVARSVARGDGAPIRWYETPAESLPLPDDSFDVAFCQLALQFMSDKPAAVRQIRRVLAPGGRALISVPRPSAFFAVLHDAIARHVSAEAAAFMAMVFSLNDPAEVSGLVRAAGFADAAVELTSQQMRLPAAHEFVWQYIHCTPLSTTLSAAPESRRRALEEEVVAGWRPWAAAGGLIYEQEMLVATARKEAPAEARA
jgi:ubiquinone/menaquinone biosynthesis C-methylase UbiE